jgi:protein-S-isoprenylcysteine O-methyltransferase Ste14
MNRHFNRNDTPRSFYQSLNIFVELPMKNLLVNYLLIILSFVAIPYLLYSAWLRPHNEILFIAGSLLAIAGTIFLAVARVNLGASFAVTAQAKDLVTKGLYSKIRHPVYFFAQLMLFGLILSFGEFLLLIPWIFLIIMQVKRARKEEEVLAEKFGDQYIAYKMQTWF